MFKAARFVNLILSGVLTGNEFGGFVGFHPALYRLPPTLTPAPSEP